MKLSTIDWIAVVLVIIGALNWGLIGLFGYDLVKSLFGDSSTLTKIIYDIVALAGLYMIYTSTKMSKA